MRLECHMGRWLEMCTAVGLGQRATSRIWPLSQLINTIVKWDRSSSSSFSLSHKTCIGKQKGRIG